MSGFMVLAFSLFLNWIPLALVFLVLFDYPNGLIYSFLLILAAGAFAVSPINENIGRFTLGCRPATTAERNKILGAWKSVTEAIGNSLDYKTKARFERVDLFVSDEKLPNAFALGNNTICVTKGLLNFESPANIAGVLAHEAGHLHFGDSQRLAVALTSNQVGIVSYNVINFGIRIVGAITKAMGNIGAALRSEAGIFAAFMGLICWFGVLMLNTFLRIFYFISKIAMDLSIRAIGRREEFRADLFAKNIGFGQQLAKFLRQIEALDSAPQNIWEVLYRTHPPTAERIDRLEMVDRITMVN